VARARVRGSWINGSVVCPSPGVSLGPRLPHQPSILQRTRPNTTASREVESPRRNIPKNDQIRIKTSLKLVILNTAEVPAGLRSLPHGSRAQRSHVPDGRNRHDPCPHAPQTRTTPRPAGHRRCWTVCHPRARGLHGRGRPCRRRPRPRRPRHRQKLRRPGWLHGHQHRSLPDRRRPRGQPRHRRDRIPARPRPWHYPRQRRGRSPSPNRRDHRLQRRRRSNTGNPRRDRASRQKTRPWGLRRRHPRTDRNRHPRRARRPERRLHL